MRHILSQIDLSKLLNFDYIFKVTPPASGWYLYLLVIFILLILLALASIWVIKRQDKVYRKLQKQIFNSFLSCGIIGLFLVFCRFEQIPYLSSRLMLWLLTLVFIFLSGSILFYIRVILPEEKQELLKKQKFNKYLPRRRTDLSKKTKGKA